LAQVHKFNQPDQSGNPRYFIEFLEMLERNPEVAEMRARSYRQMRFQPGATVLDVGCGIGCAVVEMADHVGPKGSAYGVDISEAMVAEAAARAQGRANVKVSTGSASELPHPDAMFDAVRTERVLLYIPDREKALSEMMRVTKPGGRVVLTDTEIDCSAIYSKDRALTRKMTSLVAEAIPHPTSARDLPALMRSAGFENVTADYFALKTTFEFCLIAMRGTLLAAADAGRTTVGEVDGWFQGLSELNDAGDFLQLWFFVIASGTVPAKELA
jgi:ubiquinone/menaquinone biosynthesis C-methylase UbiE